MAFEKGKSGNPGGRGKLKPFADALRMEIAAVGDDQKGLRIIARALIDKASEGDMQAIKEFADRIDGKVAQAIVGGDEDDNPIVTEIIIRGVPANR
jgi:hypothetical protein